MNNNQQTVHQVPRNYPPCVLEWRANRNRVNIALNVGFYDGKLLVKIRESIKADEKTSIRNYYL